MTKSAHWLSYDLLTFVFVSLAQQLLPEGLVWQIGRCIHVGLDPAGDWVNPLLITQHSPGRRGRGGWVWCDEGVVPHVRWRFFSPRTWDGIWVGHPRSTLLPKTIFTQIRLDSHAWISLPKWPGSTFDTCQYMPIQTRPNCVYGVLSGSAYLLFTNIGFDVVAGTVEEVSFHTQM
jgi:hypothetical protein